MDETLKRCVTQMDDSFDVGSKSRGTFLKQVVPTVLIMPPSKTYHSVASSA